MKELMLVISTALSLIPQILALVKAIECPGSGPDKLALVLNFVHVAFDELAPELKKLIGGEKIISFTTKVVALIVAFLNKVGVFSKSS